MFGVFETCLVYLETLGVFEKPFGVFGICLVYLETGLVYLENL
jgi:hypothetical protein